MSQAFTSPQIQRPGHSIFDLKQQAEVSPVWQESAFWRDVTLGDSTKQSIQSSIIISVHEPLETVVPAVSHSMCEL